MRSRIRPHSSGGFRIIGAWEQPTPRISAMSVSPLRPTRRAPGGCCDGPDHSRTGAPPTRQRSQQKIRTLPLAIQCLVSDQYQDIGLLATGLMIATLPVLVLSLFLSEWFVKGMTAGAIKG